jgi:hypothetical protein
MPRLIDPHRDMWTAALKRLRLITEAIKNAVPNVRDQAPARTIWKPLMLIHEKPSGLHAQDNRHDSLKLLTYEH